MTIVAVALPSAQETVDLTDASRQWVVSADALAFVVSAVVSTSQQVGGSIGAALLNTVSAGAAAAHLAEGTGTEQVAQVHGLAVASATGAGVAVVGAVLCYLLISFSPRQT
ncbi:hypothetical protein [Sinosporangium siamense]|uniref:hypothetical protein n=1 Tax=Sinosporangium siamense TaxID=1367973 RepID=UPI00194F03A3|nr:hypothetical protein [Sinosporangium siamense]